MTGRLWILYFDTFLLVRVSFLYVAQVEIVRDVNSIACRLHLVNEKFIRFFSNVLEIGLLTVFTSVFRSRLNGDSDCPKFAPFDRKSPPFLVLVNRLRSSVLIDHQQRSIDLLEPLL